MQIVLTMAYWSTFPRRSHILPININFYCNKSVSFWSIEVPTLVDKNAWDVLWSVPSEEKRRYCNLQRKIIVCAKQMLWAPLIGKMTHKCRCVKPTIVSVDRFHRFFLKKIHGITQHTTMQNLLAATTACHPTSHIFIQVFFYANSSAFCIAHGVCAQCYLNKSF